MQLTSAIPKRARGKRPRRCVPSARMRVSIHAYFWFIPRVPACCPANLYFGSHVSPAGVEARAPK